MTLVTIELSTMAATFKRMIIAPSPSGVEILRLEAPASGDFRLDSLPNYTVS